MNDIYPCLLPFPPLFALLTGYSHAVRFSVLIPISALVYYRDFALRLNLPPRQQFSKATSSRLVNRLVEATVTILGHEQSRMSSGGREQAIILVKQFAGKSLIMFSLHRLMQY